MNVRTMPVVLQPGETRQISLPVHYTKDASGTVNPIGVIFESGKTRVRALTYLTVPEAVEVHPMITDVPGRIDYPVTLWNISNDFTLCLRIQSGSPFTSEISFTSPSVSPLEPVL